MAAAFYSPDGRLLSYYQRDAENPAEIPPGAEASGYHSDSNSHARLLPHRPDERDDRHGLSRVEHAARAGTPAALLGHRRHADVRRGPRGAAALVAAAARHLRADRRARTDDGDGVGAEELLAARRRRRRTTRSARSSTASTRCCPRSSAATSPCSAPATPCRRGRSSSNRKSPSAQRVQEQLTTLNPTLEQRVAERSAAAEQRAEELARSKNALEKQTPHPAVDPRQHERRRHRRRRRRHAAGRQPRRRGAAEGPRVGGRRPTTGPSATASIAPTWSRRTRDRTSR